MIDIYDITTALASQLKSDAAMLKEGYIVSIGEYVNMDPDIEPWCGVYNVSEDYAPGTLGHSAQEWDNAVVVRLVTQAAHLGEGEQCSALLSSRKKLILDAVQSDHTLGGVVGQLLGIKTSYSYKYDESDTILFQEVFIDLTYEVYDG